MARFQTLSLHLLGGIENPPPAKKNRTKPHIWFDNNVKAREITVQEEKEDPAHRTT